MLAAQGIISAQDLSDIQRGMAQIRAEIEAGSFQWLLDLEDVHLNIEKRLVELVGDAGKRLHTGRSRNDQVATDIRLWLREEIDTLIELLRQLRRALATVALDNAGTIMPGFTHLQVASPSPSATTCWPTPRCSAATPSAWPTAASASTACAGRGRAGRHVLPIDRERVARTLGFDGVCRNSLDAVSDRDFAIEFCAAGALVMTHVSRLSEELVLWMSPRVGFIDLADRFAPAARSCRRRRTPTCPSWRAARPAASTATWSPC